MTDVQAEPQTRRGRRGADRRRPPSLLSTVLAVVLALAGVSVMMYPAAASWFSELQQRDQLEGYAQQVESTDPGLLAERLAEARRYNAGLAGIDLEDPFTHAASGPLDDAAVDYVSQMTASPGDVMAELRIPGVAALLPVYHGTAASTLERGVGHLYGSSLPVGGPGTHAVLTGHRGYPEATLFSDLDRLREGDSFTLTTLGETLVYRVTETQVVEPDDTGSLGIVAGRDLVTLITCTPLGVNSHRLLVHAERVEMLTETEAESVVAEIPVGFPWWAIVLAVALVVCLAVLIVAARRGARSPGPRDAVHLGGSTPAST